jgi:general secretion pathway protein E
MPATTKPTSAAVIEHIDTRSLLKALYHSGKISIDEGRRVYEGLKLRDNNETHPLIAIAEMLPEDARNPDRQISLEELVEWLADHLTLPYYHIDPLRIDVARITGEVSYEYATKHNILPVESDASSVRFVCANPLDTSWREELSTLIRKDIEIAVANPLDIQRYLNEFYSLARSIDHATNRDTGTDGQLIQNLEQLIELGRTGQLDAEDHHIIQVVDWLLQYAFEQRSSDIHLEPRKEQGDIRFRIDGVLHHVYQVPPNVMTAIIGRIKTLGRMDIAEKRRPLDGRLKTKSPDGKEIELRLSTIPTAMGEKMVMRIFDPDVLQRSFEALGLTDRELTLWDQFTNQPHGIILVTGPTGSGKTTTLYSTLRRLATAEVNVCSIEDPIEMVEPAFNQMQVHQSINLNFATGVKSLLRQDPDIIMIGEIRDLETAEMAIQASLTGHLVLSTLHTNDAPSAMTRLLELGVPAYLISATVLGVMAQRLVRTLCPHCKNSLTIEEADWKALVGKWNIEPEQASQPEGCLECRHTGYLGRVGLYEMMELTPDMKKKIVPGANLEEIRAQAIADGLMPLRISGAKKIARGLTTLSEVYRVTPAEN